MGFLQPEPAECLATDKLIPPSFQTPPLVRINEPFSRALAVAITSFELLAKLYHTSRKGKIGQATSHQPIIMGMCTECLCFPTF